MFSDPQSVTISGTTISLPKVNSLSNGSEYMSADALVKLTAQHSYGRRTRRVLRLDHSKIAPTIENASINAIQSMSTYLVFDIPRSGYTNAEALAVYVGLKTQMAASSDALITKLLGGES